jgi:hypothetical protein
MGNFLKSKKSGMVGYRVPSKEDADKVIEYFKNKGSELAWFNQDKWGMEVLISEKELQRLDIRYYDVTKDMRANNVDIGNPAIYGDPHFTYL